MGALLRDDDVLLLRDDVLLLWRRRHKNPSLKEFEEEGGALRTKRKFL
jgi:hypothetical protein